MEYVLYVTDCETTGLDSRLHDIIELSLLRLNDGEQKTWCIKPSSPENIDLGALRVNGHKLEELRHETKIGRDKYLVADQVLVDIENWIAADGMPAEQRILVGQNISFDRERFEQLWIKNNAKDTFPFGRKLMDTMQIEIFLNYCEGGMDSSYSLAALTKKYSIKNEKAHSAAADTFATKEVFMKQVEKFKKILSK